MVAVAALVLLVLATTATADLTIQQTVLNSCTGDLDMQCKMTLGKDYGLQTLLPGGTFLMSVTSTLEDSDLTCTFTSKVLEVLKTPRSYKVWQYLKSGFTDFPEMTCTDGCFWKAQDDGLYYGKGAENYVLLVLWADILPGVIV